MAVLDPDPTGTMRTRSLFQVPRMDCPSEERMIRLALDEILGVKTLDFDLPARQLAITHDGPVAEIHDRLLPLGLGVQLLESSAIDPAESAVPDLAATDQQERQTLWMLLAINAAMFLGELITGWLAQSTGLIADSLDMLADAGVYGLSLYAVGRASKAQMRVAHVSGWLQMLLAFGVLGEVVRRFYFGSNPEPGWMMGISLLALMANVACLYLISRHRGGAAHMKASWIFSTNDVLANVGVILAGALVAWTRSSWPDLLIGSLIGGLVLSGAIRILRLR